jgi:hypothetical protein
MDRDLVNQAQGNTLGAAGNKEHKLQADEGALAGARAGMSRSVQKTKGGGRVKGGRLQRVKSSRAANSERSDGLVPVVHVSKASPSRCAQRVPLCVNITCQASPRG